MKPAIEAYGIIGNSHTAALVGRDGSIDWLCLPRFDREAVFAALLGDIQNGRWLITSIEQIRKSARSYRGETGILETRIETDSGSATIIDFMPLPDSDGQIDLIRLVRGDSGQIRMRTEIVLRFDLWSKHPVGSPSVRRVARRLGSKRGPVHHAGDAAWHAGSRYI